MVPKPLQDQTQKALDDLVTEFERSDEKSKCHQKLLEKLKSFLDSLKSSKESINDIWIASEFSEGELPLISWIIEDSALDIDLMGNTKRNEAEIGELVNLCLDYGANLETPGGGFQCTPLHYATLCNSLTATETFLAHGANAHARDIDGLTILHLAVVPCKNFKKNIAMIELLLAQGVDIFATNSKGETALELAKDMGSDAGLILWLEDVQKATLEQRELEGITLKKQNGNMDLTNIKSDNKKPLKLIKSL